MAQVFWCLFSVLIYIAELCWCVLDEMTSTELEVVRHDRTKVAKGLVPCGDKALNFASSVVDHFHYNYNSSILKGKRVRDQFNRNLLIPLNLSNI